MNDLCCKYSKDCVYLNSFDCVFVHKESRCIKKDCKTDSNIQTKNYQADINGYSPEDLIMN